MPPLQSLCLGCFWMLTVSNIAGSEDCGVQIDLVIAVDASGSVGSRNFRKSLDYVKEVVNSSVIEDGRTRIGVLTYSFKPDIVFHLNEYNETEKMMTAIDGIHYTQGGTFTGSALEGIRVDMLVPTKGDRPDAENVILLMTDGVSSNTDIDPKIVAKNLHENGTVIFVLGIGSGVSETELKGIATDPDETYLLITTSFDELDGIGDTQMRNICSGVESPSTAKPRSTSCRCPCSRLGDARYVNLTDAEVEQLINGYKHDLLLNKNSLSSGHRKTSSIDDDRDSSKVLGIVIVIVFIGAPCTVLFLIDMDRFCKWFNKKRSTYKTWN